MDELATSGRRFVIVSNRGVGIEWYCCRIKRGN